MVKVRGRNSNGKTVKQTVKNGRKSRVTTPRGGHESWCQASAVRGCVPILSNPEFDAALDRDSCVTHWMSSPGSALWYTDIPQSFFCCCCCCCFVSVVWQDSDRVQSVTQGTWYSGRSSMLSSDSWLIDIGERSHPNPMHRRLIRCSSATSKTGNRFGWSFFFAVWRRCARSQLHMNSVVLVESRGSCALVRIVRLQKFDRRDNIIFTVHLNRLIDENTPLEQSTIETCLQVPESYEKFPVTSGQGSKHRDWTASQWWARWQSQSSSCQHHVITWRGLIPADHEYLDSVAWPCHDCEVAPVWHHDVTNPRTCQFSAVCLTVFPFEFRPRTFTIGFYGKNSIVSELMILECSFPLITPVETSCWRTGKMVLRNSRCGNAVMFAEGCWACRQHRAFVEKTGPIEEQAILSLKHFYFETFNFVRCALILCTISLFHERFLAFIAAVHRYMSRHLWV